MEGIEKGIELNDLKFSPEFFRDEVREGFYVTTMMKRYWASQLKVLSIIARICDKHGINWFVDYGTLLGAIRHGGYIPWDDDLDICMLRGDWLRFFEVAKNELPAGFEALTLSENENYAEVIGRVVNSVSIDCGKEHLREFYGCPYTVGVDIFPLDGLYEDDGKEKERRNRANEALMEYLKSKDRNQALEIEKIYMECSDIDAKKLALMPFYVPKGDHVFPAELFENVVKLFFEGIMINVPGRYEEVLEIEYGDFMTARRGGGLHDYPAYRYQEKILGEKMGRNPFSYTMDFNELSGSVKRYGRRMIEQAQDDIKKYNLINSDNFAGEKSGKQKVAVFLPCKAAWWDSMEPLWKEYFDDESTEVHVLPIFYYDSDYNGNIGEKHDERALFPEYLNVEDCEKFDFAGIHPDIVVTQVPYDGYNTAMTVHEFFYSANLLRFTDELIYVPCFDMEPPMDENDKAATAISVFVEQEGVVNADRVVLKSEQMRRFYIEKLVELSSEDTRQYWEQKIVVLENGDNKERKSTEVSDRGNGESGNEKRLAKTEDGNVGGRKLIVYYVGISSLLRYGSDAIEKIRESFDIFEEASDKLDVVFTIQWGLMENLEIVAPELLLEFKQILETIPDRKNITYEPGQQALLPVDDFDAYYGDASPYVRKCVLQKIPVMIQNYEIRKS